MANRGDDPLNLVNPDYVLPDFTETRARMALHILFCWGSELTSEEAVYDALKCADAILLGSMSITLAAEEELRSAHKAKVDAVLGSTPNSAEKL